MHTTLDLFDEAALERPPREPLADGAAVLHDYAREAAPELLAALPALLAESPWRQWLTPGGQRMSVAMTNSGPWGWVSDRAGYRYERIDPLTGRPWPALPHAFRQLAVRAAAAAGFDAFEPDACLVNRYQAGTRLSLHQDRDEAAYSAPIVSVSLGLAATFLFGGARRADPVRRVRLLHGDVVVWGGPARLAYHGVAPLREGHHELTGQQRINLTFRRSAA